MIPRFIVGLIGGLILASAGAAATYDEAMQGDLSDDRLAPTPFPLNAPSSLLAGSVTFGERDYFTVTVPVGAALNKIILTRYESSNARAFIGLQVGSQVTLDPSGNTSDGLLGYMHFGFDQVIPGNLLVDLARSIPPGFSLPLPAGNYSFWVNQTEPAPTFYEFNFTTAVKVVGDYSGNGHVDAADYTIWRDTFGHMAMPFGAGADGDADGAIGVSDYEVWKSRFGDKSIGRAVPEPTALRLVALWGVAVALGRNVGTFRARLLVA